MSFKNIGRAAACLVFAVAPGVVLANSVPALTTCAAGVPVEFEGRHYEVVSSNGISWVNADDASTGKTFRGVPGHLATITSEAEDRFVESLRKCARGNGTLTRNAVWVGGFQEACSPQPGCGWKWVNDEGPISTRSSTFTPVTYSNWLPNEPNDLGGESHLTVGHTGAFGWNDEGNLGNIGGYIVEYNTAQIVDVGECLLEEGCKTNAGQTLTLPPIELTEDSSIGVRTFEFTDPRFDSSSGKCAQRTLTLFGSPDPRPALIIPAYLCGSPKFLVVEIKKSDDIKITQGTVIVENNPELALPGNLYVCKGERGDDGEPPVEPLNPLRDPQKRDVVAWQATYAVDMLENTLGGGAQFPGALGEFTFECGSSRGLTRNLSYLVIGMHINFGIDFASNPGGVNERFVALTGYKLQLLQQSVQDSRSALKNGDFTSLRALVRNAIQYHGRGDFDLALEKIEVFLKQVDQSTYRTSDVNHNGEHLARGKNIKFMYEEKVIPFAP